MEPMGTEINSVMILVVLLLSIFTVIIDGACLLLSATSAIILRSRGSTRNL